MILFICKFCNQERKSKKSLTGHETFCKLNPNHKIQTTEKARQSAKKKSPCGWCGHLYSKTNMTKHHKSCRMNPDFITKKSKKCPVCDVSFFGDAITCSYSCSNTHFRHANEGGFKYKTDEQLTEQNRYRDLCFRYHEKKCVVCLEDKIVEVHHLNEDHSDNRPENLIPLCPTHHKYFHSRYKYIVDPFIEKYFDQWANNGDEEAGSSAAFGA